MEFVNENNKNDECKITEFLNWVYFKVVNGFQHGKSPEDLAKQYLEKSESIDEAINKLIKMKQVECGLTGFISGLGGAVTLPVTIPANMTSLLYIQIRMVATIAIIKGYDLQDDKVRSLVLATLIGAGAEEVLKKAGIKVGSKLSSELIKKIPTEIIKQINKRVGFRLLTKFGEKGVVNLGKLIPCIGGIIGGSVDATGTYTVGKVAKKIFV